MTLEGLSPSIIGTIQASRRASTNRIYDATWRVFCCWCHPKDIVPSQALTHQILDFLQEGLDAALSPNTLRRQVATLSSVLLFRSNTSLAQNPLIRCFLNGATNLRPPVLHRYPTWDLTMVLQVLTDLPLNLCGKLHSGICNKRWPSWWQSPRLEGYRSWLPYQSTKICASFIRIEWF